MRITLLLAALVLLAAACGDDGASSPSPPADDESVEYREDGTLTFYRPGDGDIVTIAIEFAETEQAITRGLMGRRQIPSRWGMLFIMPRTQIQSFWMANTPTALDITFVAPDSTVINSAKYTRPFSSESHASEAPARYVIETAAGFTDTYGIIPGDRVRWTRSN